MDAYSNPTLDTRPCEVCESPRHGTRAHDRLERLTREHEPVRLARITSESAQDFTLAGHRVVSMKEAVKHLGWYAGPVRVCVFELEGRRVVAFLAENIDSVPPMAPPGNSGVDTRGADDEYAALRQGAGGPGRGE